MVTGLNGYIIKGFFGCYPTFFQPAVLERLIIVVIDVVHTDDFISSIQQLPGHVKADESRRAGHQHPHDDFLPS
ncbi:hypothetical protein ES708_25469 [subsurface metagenome]